MENNVFQLPYYQSHCRSVNTCQLEFIAVRLTGKITVADLNVFTSQKNKIPAG